MSEGLVVERGAPHELLQVVGGAFRAMVEAVPESQRLTLQRNAAASFENAKKAALAVDVAVGNQV